MRRTWLWAAVIAVTLVVVAGVFVWMQRPEPLPPPQRASDFRTSPLPAGRHGVEVSFWNLKRLI
mgnify:CR=1 FL=1